MMINESLLGGLNASKKSTARQLRPSQHQQQQKQISTVKLQHEGIWIIIPILSHNIPMILPVSQVTSQTKYSTQLTAKAFNVGVAESVAGAAPRLEHMGSTFRLDGWRVIARGDDMGIIGDFMDK